MTSVIATLCFIVASATIDETLGEKGGKSHFIDDNLIFSPHS